MGRGDVAAWHPPPLPRLRQWRIHSFMWTKDTPKVGVVQPDSTPPKLKLKKKKTGYIDFMLFKAVCDLYFSFNQLLKRADDLYIRILKERKKKLRMLFR